MLRCGVSKRCPMKRETAVVEQAMGLRTEAYWMPFTHNRYLKKHPRSRILARAEGAYYTSAEGKRLFDCISGMWCCPLGHGHPKIAEAVARQVKELDYSLALKNREPRTCWVRSPRVRVGRCVRRQVHAIWHFSACPIGSRRSCRQASIAVSPARRARWGTTWARAPSSRLPQHPQPRGQRPQPRGSWRASWVCPA